MAGNVTNVHQFADDVGPEPLALLDQSFDAVVQATNSLNTYSNFYPDTGTTNAVVLTTPPGQTVAYGDGLVVSTRVAATNTGPVTLNVNNLGALPILNASGSQLVGGELQANSIYTFVYNAGRNAWQFGGGSGGGEVVAPFSVTNPDGQVALAINEDGTGYIGNYSGCGLQWDAQCNFNFEGGAGLRDTAAPFSITDAGGNVLFNVDADGSGKIQEGGGSPCEFVWGDYAESGGIADACFFFRTANWTTLPNPPLTPWLAAFANNGTVAGQNFGVYICAGTNVNDTSFEVDPSVTHSPNDTWFRIRGDGSGILGPIGNALVWDSTGKFTLTGTATLPMPPFVDLPGISITNPQNGQALVYMNGSWVNETPNNALATLTDVTLTTPVAQGSSLVFNSTTQKWENGTAPMTLEMLSNTHIAGPAAGQVLTYSVNPVPGWINANIPNQAFLNSLSISNPQPGQAVTWNGTGWVAAFPGEMLPDTLGSLSDVSISAPLINRQVLTFDAPNNVWFNAPVPTPSFATLADVTLTSQTQGQAVTWDAPSQRWVNTTLPPVPAFAVSAPTHGQVLAYDSTTQAWVNTPAGGGGGGGALATLSDVAFTALGNGALLRYDTAAARWQNTNALTVANIGGADTVTVTAGTNVGNSSFRVLNLGQSAEYFRINGDGSGFLGANTTHRLGFYTGAVEVSADPTTALGIATKQYVDNRIAALATANGLTVPP